MNKIVLLVLLGLAAVACADDMQPDQPLQGQGQNQIEPVPQTPLQGNSQQANDGYQGYAEEPLPQSPPEPVQPKDDYSHLRNYEYFGGVE
ncbi:hypothetical protein FO519_008698 [Halicephalobus sp. NKZ332]|nr:hypothetical protein FO519_008698 [Halicephalobus sp. NKZ332]